MILPGGASLIASATWPSIASIFARIRVMNSSRDNFGVDSMARFSRKKGPLPILTNRQGSRQENLPHPRRTLRT
jgi:hypothetical protein